MKVNPIELRYWRERRVLDKKELADAAGIGRSTYYALESGSQPRATAQTIRKIAKALQVKPEKLVDVDRPADLVDIRVDHAARAKIRSLS